MSWASEIPAELLRRPMGLVILTGLDFTHNAIHKSIWDSFCNNRRPDRVPLQFKIYSGDHEYPKMRSSHTSYEWYIPKGILKSNWMNKHLNTVPAVTVIFFDLDWDEALWKEKQMECATLVQIIRAELLGRNTKVAVVLIQKNPPLPPGEDIMATERAASLCSTCDLSSKSLFVLPHNTDHLLGYTIRLENAFYELAQSYYSAEARKVKSHKDFLNKTNHQLLFVRHQFKISFFNETKQDSHTALKHYKLAYGHVLELRMHDNNCLEIKTIAGFINYKICRLSFQHNIPLDAIAQFRKHIDFFKMKVGPAELAFEHSAWMSRQFQVFGDLFDEAIKLGLTAIQTQHPGVYYQQAANHAIARKQLCVGLCHHIEEKSISWNPLENINNLDYYGQRPWRQGHQRIELPDPQNEKEAIAALQNLELTVDHSWIIIPLLGSAVTQFKKYKSPRMKRYLMVQMGEEYFYAKDYSKSLMFLKKVMYDYRTEKWYPLLTSVLDTSLKCAYLLGAFEDYIALCIEMMGEYTTCSIEEKTRIQMNVIRMMSSEVAEPEPGLHASCVKSAREKWMTLSDQPIRFDIDMANLSSFVDCKGLFYAESLRADEQVKLSVFIRINSQFPLRFSKLFVSFYNSVYDQYCVVTDGQGISASSEVDTADLYLIPGVVKRYNFSFFPTGEVPAVIQINSISLELGTQQRCAVLIWRQSAMSKTDMTGFSSLDDIRLTDWSSIKPNSSTSVKQRPAQVDVELSHDPPALVDEFYRVSVTVSSNEAIPIYSTDLSMELYETDSGMEQNTHISVGAAEFSGQVISKQSGISFGSMQPNETAQKVFYIKSLHTGNRVMAIKVSYSIDVKMDAKDSAITCRCTAEQRFSLPVLSPLQVSTKLMSMQLSPIETVHIGLPYILMPEITCMSPWEIDIGHSELHLQSSSRLADKYESQIKGVCLKESEGGAESHCIISDATGSLGQYYIYWRRKNTDLPFVLSSHPLPYITVESLPLLVELTLPAYGSVKSLINLCYVLHNKTSLVQDVDASMDSSDNFMFSGNKHIHFRILPLKTYTLHYNIFPLMSGLLSLPKVHINVTRYPKISDTIQTMIPTHIFIKPTAKSASIST